MRNSVDKRLRVWLPFLVGTAFLFLFPFDWSSWLEWLSRAYSLGLLILYVIVSGHVRKLGIIIGRVQRCQEAEDTEKALRDNSQLSNIWQSYAATFDDSSNGTWQRAGVYFNESVLSDHASHSGRFERWRILPGSFVGFGILGTFLGITLGLRGFDPTSVDTIQTSIEGLLGGMTTAFLTSIFGVALSLAFNFLILQPHLARTGDTLHRLCVYLDERHHMSSIGRLQMQMVARVDGQSIPPGEMNRLGLDELRSQTEAIQLFTSDLATSLQNFTEEVTNRQQEFAEQMLERQKRETYEMYTKEIRPVLDELYKGIQSLGDFKKESAGDVISGIVDSLNESLGGMVDEFRRTISGGTLQQLDDIVTVLAETADQMKRMPSVIENQTAAVERLLHSFKEQVDRTQSLMFEIGNTQERLTTMHESMESTSESLSGSAHSLNDATTSLVERSSEMTSQSHALVDAMSVVVQSVKDASISISQVDTNIGSVFTHPLCQDSCRVARTTTAPG